MLNDFVRLDATIQAWHEPEFEQTLRDFQQRFTDTGTEEGTVMATLLRFVAGNLTRSRRAAILEEFRDSDRVRELFDRGKRELASRSE